jgi:hypothetical protein
VKNKKIINYFFIFILLFFLILEGVFNNSNRAKAQECPNDVDILFILDTSGSMGDEWEALCNKISTT